MRALSRSIVGLAVLVSATCLVATSASFARWGADYLPNVELVTQDGEKVRFYDDVVKGKIVVFSFIYTTCRDICPLVTARMAQVYDALGDAAGRDVHFVSISIDPENDTPAMLKEHADAFRDDPRWVFLTGKPKDVHLVRYKLGERSRKLTEHDSHVMLYNDRTQSWARDSAFADAGRLALTIRQMDPVFRDKPIAGAGLTSEPTVADPGLESPGQALFAKACASCHSIGDGDRVGPDLKGVTKRRERQWLMRFVRTPKVLHAAGDPVAKDLAAKFPKVRMPNLDLSENDVSDLLTYVEARSFAVAAGPSQHHHDHGAHGHGSGANDHGAHEAKAGKAADSGHANHKHDGHHGHHGHSHHHGH